MLSGSSRLAAFSSSGGASLPSPEAKATWARSRSARALLELVERPGLRRLQQFQGLAERAGLHAGLRRGQDAFGMPRRIGGQQHRPLQERRGRGQPAAGLRPARRALQLAATSSSGPAAAWARCQARRSGSACGSVTSASAACSCCLSGSDADR